jgi:hypothetical protein
MLPTNTIERFRTQEFQIGIAHVLTSGSTPYAGMCARMTTVIALLSLNLGIVYADILKAGGFEGSAPKPTPPRDYIPRRRRCAFPAASGPWRCADALLRLVSFRATRIGPSSEGKLGPLWGRSAEGVSAPF